MKKLWKTRRNLRFESLERRLMMSAAPMPSPARDLAAVIGTLSPTSNFPATSPILTSSAVSQSVDVLYGIASGSLFTINKSTGSNTLVGRQASGSTISAIAFDPTTDVLYGIANGNLYTINKSTGVNTLVGHQAAGFTITSIAFDPSTDVLYGIASGNLYTINKSTGTNKPAGHQAVGFTITSIAFDPSTDVLYGIANGSLYAINKSTGANRLVGRQGSGFTITSIAFDPSTDVLYGIASGNLYTINKSTGMNKLVGHQVVGSTITSIVFGLLPGTIAPGIDQVTSANFQQQVMQSPVSVLVDFSADWCGWCLQQAPILEQIVQGQPDVKVVEIDYDVNPSLDQQFNVDAVPRLLVFQNGQKVADAVGLQTEAQLLAMLG